jgi:hypothetical protein
VNIYFSFTLVLFSACQNQTKKNVTLSEAEGQKPNIIYILADDLGYAELGATDSQKLKHPTLMRWLKTECGLRSITPVRRCVRRPAACCSPASTQAMHKSGATTNGPTGAMYGTSKPWPTTRIWKDSVR